MPITRQLTAGIILVLVLAALLAILATVSRDDPPSLMNATLLPEPKPIAEFALFDDAGMKFDQAALLGRWTLLFFGFTNCPDVCPLTLQQLASVRAELLQRGQAPVPDIVFISVDPERDSQATLAAYVAHFGEGIRGASAALPALQQFTSDLGIFFRREPGPPQSYQVSHSAAVLLVNPRGELHAILSAPQNTAALVNDLPILMDAQ
ncbi:MAG: SCO family protein [Woeseia sp.]